MTKIKSIMLFSAMLLLQAGIVFAQRPTPRPPSSAEGCAACGVCGGTIMAPVIFLIVLFVINIALLVWVAKDAKARGLDNSVLWMALVFFTGLIGFAIYYFSRPQGELGKCAHCGNDRLKVSAKCPTCGNA